MKILGDSLDSVDELTKSSNRVSVKRHSEIVLYFSEKWKMLIVNTKKKLQANELSPFLIIKRHERRAK